MNKLISMLNELLAIHSMTRVNGNVASHSTATSAGQTLRTCFSDLYKIGYRIQDPKNLTNTHIEVLCKHWHAEGRAISTIQERLSRLRIFCGWVNKAGMIKSLPDYLPDVNPSDLKVSRIAAKSKSWTENGIDVAAKIMEADEFDWRFGLMLRMELSFGLRRMEVLQLRPWKSDKGDKLAIYEAKNGRPRDVYIDTPEQRMVLDQIKLKITKQGYLGWTEMTSGKVATLKYSMGRYNKSMAKIGITRDDVGVTGHGLRAQFAENAALIAHMIPPTLGGTGGQMDREDLNVKRAQISELLGHARIDITSSYYGSFGRNAKPDEAGRCKNNIDLSFIKMRQEDLLVVPGDRLIDCLQLVAELAGIDVDITLKQIYCLWQVHSKRHAIDWIKPLIGNAEALEVAALTIGKREQIIN